MATSPTTEAPSSTPAPTTTEGTTPSTTPTTESQTESGAIEWEPISDTVDAGVLTVPVDYDDPDGETLDLFVSRFNALDPENRIGVMFVNPGGPGFGGADYATFAAQIFDEEILQRFDIIGWDPRGTGNSVPAIDCIDDYDQYFTALDGTPDDDAEYQALVDSAEEFVAECQANNPEILNYVGTNNAARDIDAIRSALGEQQANYFGFSYGSELGATWATLFPETVRAAVLDGAADPNADAFESLLQQMQGFQESVERFLESCAATDSCGFDPGDDPAAALEEFLADLDENPIEASPDRPPVNRDVAIGAIVQAMYSDVLWPSLEQSLQAAVNGDGSGLLRLYDQYYQRQPDGTYGNELEAFQSISCADTEERPTVEETDDETVQLREVAPLLVPEGAAGGYFCNFYPPALDPRVEITGVGAGPIVVIGTTGDPATPLSSTRAMAETLEDGRLVIVDANQHTGYGLNQCVIDVVNDYLIDLEAPADGTECG